MFSHIASGRFARAVPSKVWTWTNDAHSRSVVTCQGYFIFSAAVFGEMKRFELFSFKVVKEKWQSRALKRENKDMITIGSSKVVNFFFFFFSLAGVIGKSSH